jgi:glycosyltransferase involved in cell wall biosynthesis
LIVGKSSDAVLQRWGKAGRAVPFQTDPVLLAQYYCAADVVLVASLWETFGRIPAEAQMCGIPVVGFATGGIPEVVENGLTGMLTEPQNGLGLGAALTTAAAHPELRDRMGRAGAERARRLFGNESVAENYVRHYRSVIAARRAAARSHRRGTL